MAELNVTAGVRPVRGRLAIVIDQLTLWWTFAVVTGFLQLTVARSLGLGFSIFRWGWESRDLAWRVPAGYLIVFAPVAALLILLAALLGARLSFRVVAWVWLTLCVFSILLLFPQIQGYASLFLAAGIALVLSRRLAAAERPVLAMSRLLGVGGVVLVGAMAYWLPRQRASRENATITALPAAPAGAPNVLLIILDTVRADYLSLYGAPEATTPNLVRWAAKATVFDQAYSTAPWTTPSHASLFTGQFPSAHNASFTRALSNEHRTLATIFQERGWATGGFTANFVATRFESGLSQGFIRYDDLKNSLEEIAKSTTITQADNVLLAWNELATGRRPQVALKRFLSTDFTPHFTEHAHDEKSAEEVRSQFVSWVDDLPAGRPFFAFLNFFDAHSPYRPPQPYFSMFKQPPLTVDRYRGGVRYIDDQLDSLFRALENRGVLENTIVIVTADHGEQFGEHGQRAHGNSLYRQLLHVPLFVMFPRRVPAGTRVERQVTGRDVPATILELASLPRDTAIGGTSLVPTMRDSTARGSDVVAEVDQNMRLILRFKNSLGPMKAYVDDSVHVIRDGTGAFEAYRYRTDPAEASDLVAASGDSVPFASRLSRLVSTHRLTWPRVVPRKKTVDVDDGRGQ